MDIKIVFIIGILIYCYCIIHITVMVMSNMKRRKRAINYLEIYLEQHSSARDLLPKYNDTILQMREIFERVAHHKYALNAGFSTIVEIFLKASIQRVGRSILQ